jgi:type 2 lantibiotic biosynthesis protein LanM
MPAAEQISLSGEVLAAIAAKASSLEERLAGRYTTTAGSSAIRERRLNRWREKVAKGDPALFERLMELRGIRAGGWDELLGDVSAGSGCSLPEWTDWFASGLSDDIAGPRGYFGHYPSRYLSDAEPIPFERLFVPFADVAIARMRIMAGDACGLLSEAAHAALERALLRRLAGPCAAALSSEWRGQIDPVAFFTEYPVLAHTVATVMRNWAAFVSEFLLRLATDLDALQQAFSPLQGLGIVEEVVSGLSDPHEGGRTVLAIRFESGLKLAYKPRSLESDVAWNGLLEWVNAQGLSLPLQGSSVLARPGYGWCAWISHEQCRDDDERRRFYRRSGMLLALFHVLGSSDVHNENLIAAGEHPMLVDSETLITPLFFALQAAPALNSGPEVAMARLGTSVLATHMLPAPGGDTGDKSVDLSGLGGVGGEQVEVKALGRTLTAPRHKNAPFADSEAAEPARFTECVLEGFREAYRMLSQRRAELTAPDGPLRAIAKAPVRLVFRDTRVYGIMLMQSHSPQASRDGVDRSIELESLNRIMLTGEPNLFYLSVIEAEKRALEQIDIPFFYVIPERRAVLSGGRTIADGFLREAPFDVVLRRIDQLSEAGCEEQAGVIRGSLYAKALTQRCSIGKPVLKAAAATVAATVAGLPFHEAAIEIARDLSRRAVFGPDGSCTWIGLQWRPKAGAYRFDTAGVSLYDGLGGIALFLAALEKTTGSREFRSLLEGTLRSARAAVSQVTDKPKWNRSTDKDMEACLSMDPLLRAGKMANDAETIRCACDAARLATPQLLAADKRGDLYFGTVGVLNGLLGLWEFDPREEYREAALACGAKLAASEEPAAGKGPALARLYAATGNTRYLRAARLEPATPWTEGAAGAGIASLATLAFADSAETRGEIEAAIDQITRSPLPATDNLLHGAFGEASFLLNAAEQLGRPELRERAEERAHAAVVRAGGAGGYRLLRELPNDAFTPGFITGTAGIGYELLRLAFPGRLSR